MANDRDPETNAAAFLGAELRRARLAAGITSQDKLAQMLGYDRSVIAKAETGERPPSEDVMKALVKALGLDRVVTRLASLVRRSTEIPAWFLDWVAIEREAVTLHTWQPALIPGLLHTPEYARAILTSWRLDTDGDIEAKLAARIDRQAILDRDDPPDLCALLDESVPP
jgi:transcriptional regulator with XRE-family HTH domain